MRKRIYFEDAKLADVYAVIVLDEPNVVYINATGNPRGVILLLPSLRKHAS